MNDEDIIYEIDNLQLDNYYLLLNESLFYNGNGYIGIRSAFEEGYPNNYNTIRGQYINGFYDLSPMKQAEPLYGLVKEKQTMLNICDTQSINITIDGELFSMFDGTVLKSKRWVNMSKGVTGRYLLWRSPNGNEIEITITRMTSFYHLPLFTIEYSMVPVNFSGEVIIESEHNGNVLNHVNEHDPRVAHERFKYLTPISCEIKDDSSYITSVTSKSNLEICSCVKNVLFNDHDSQFIVDDQSATCKLTTNIESGKKIRLIKYSIFCDSIRYEDFKDQAYIEMEKALSVPIEYLYNKQEVYLHEYWDNCKVEIYGDKKLNTDIHYNLFQLIQSVGKDPHSNIAPKGLSGEGYEGHYFWDTEMYILPFFTITNPQISINLIKYRYCTLTAAKEHARILGHSKGALYPWRTIMGKECSGYFPSGSAQYHINGDIAYSIIYYYLATKDIELIGEMGGEIIFETARLWIDVGNFHNNKFLINDVTGPDEYTCIVNNNYYTNAIAQYHLKWAVKFYKILKSSVYFDSLVKKLDINEEEIMEFEKASKLMYLPYDKELDINPQDDSFLQKKLWKLNSIPKNKFPLLLNYHPLHLYRHQICKQPDTVMAHFILEDDQTYKTMLNSFNYYENITTHDSSLSSCIFSIMASKLGMYNKAYNYFEDTAHLDLLDKKGNTIDGIHTANMAGNYMAIVYGFAGFRLKESGISFSPILPDSWDGYRLKICYQEHRIVIEVDKKNCHFILEKGDAITIMIYNKEHKLENELFIPRNC